MTKNLHFLTPSNCTSLEHLTALTKQGGLATPLLDTQWWNVAVAISGYQNPNQHNPLIKDDTTRVWEIETLNKHLPWHLSSPTDIYRSICKKHPIKPLHHDYNTVSNHWQDLIRDLHTPGIPHSTWDQALWVATNMKPPNNRMAHVCKVAPTCRHGCDSPETVKHILNRCQHNSELRQELKLNPMKTLNIIPNSPDSAKSAAKTIIGLYNFHTSTLPGELARVEVCGALGLPTQAKFQTTTIIHPRFEYNPP